MNIIEETPVTKHIQNQKTDQNTLINTQREREVTNFKFTYFTNTLFLKRRNLHGKEAKRVRNAIIILTGDEEQSEKDELLTTEACQEQVSRKRRRQREFGRRAVALFLSLCLRRPARPRFGYVNLLLAVR